MTVTIVNSGATASNVSLDLSPELDVFLPGFSCANAGSTWRCTAASLPQGTYSQPIFLRWSGAQAGTSKSLNATITSTTPDSNVANNTATASIGVTWQTTLFLQNDTGVRTATGAHFEVVAEFYTDGPSPADNLTVTFSLPASATFVSATSDFSGMQCSTPPVGSAGDVVCSISSITDIAPRSIDVQVLIDPTLPAGRVLKFPVSIACSYATNPNISQVATVTVSPPADLSVQLSAPASAYTGDTFADTMTVTNNGPAEAEDVAITLAVTKPALFGTLSIPSGWSCSKVSYSQSYVCGIGSLPAGATAAFTIPLYTLPKVDPTTVQLFARGGASNDPIPANDSTNAQTVVSHHPACDLAVSMSAAPKEIHVGDTVQFTLSVTNVGAEPSVNTTVSYLLQQPNLTLLAATCSGHPCNIDPLLPGATKTITISATVNAVAAFTVFGSADADNDYTPGNNLVQLDMKVGPPAADLSLSVEAPTIVRVGDTVRYVMQITNVGNATASNVTLRHKLPPGIHFVSSTAHCGGDPVTTCALGTLQAQAAMTVEVTTIATEAGTGSAETSVATDSPEGNLDNNVASVMTTITPARRRAAHH